MKILKKIIVLLTLSILLTNGLYASEIVNNTTPIKFNHLAGTQIPFDTSHIVILFIENGIYYYANQNDSNSLYKLENGINTKIANTSIDYFLFQEGNHIYFRKSSDKRIYCINKDGTEERNINNSGTNGYSSSAIAWDSNNFYFQDSNNYYIRKISKDGGEEQNLIGSRSYLMKADGDYVYYQLNNSYAYKISPDGNNNTLLVGGNGANILDYDENYLYYQNFTDLKMYRMNKDGSNSILLFDGTIGSNTDYKFSDTSYLYFMSAGLLRKVAKDGSTNSTLIDTSSISYYGNDSNYIYYKLLTGNYDVMIIDHNGTTVNNYSPGLTIIGAPFIDNGNFYYPYNATKVFKVTANTTLAGYSYKDPVFKSSQIISDNNLSSAYIKVDSTLQGSTSYNFYLANNKTVETLINENTPNVSLSCFGMLSIGDEVLGMQVASKITTGDTVTFFQNGIEESTTISGISHFGPNYYLNFGTQLSSCASLTNAGLKIENINYTPIDKSLLDGTHQIDFSSTFDSFSPTKNLWYEFDLTGDNADNTHTPIINSIKITDTTQATNGTGSNNGNNGNHYGQNSTVPVLIDDIFSSSGKTIPEAFTGSYGNYASQEAHNKINEYEAFVKSSTTNIKMRGCGNICFISADK